VKRQIEAMEDKFKSEMKALNAAIRREKKSGQIDPSVSAQMRRVARMLKRLSVARASRSTR